jgi:hypothetical protein
MIYIKSKSRKRNFFLVTLLAGCLFLGSLDTNVKSNAEMVKADISIIRITGVFDGEPGNTHVSVFGFTIYDGQKAAARRSARQARRAARRAARQ